MKLKSRKATMLLAIGFIFILMPIMPVFIGANTTNELNETDTYVSTNERTASYVENTRNIVAVSAYENLNKEKSLFDGKAIAIADPYLEVRDNSDDDSAVIARMYKNSICDVLEQDGQWARIQSGDIVGYVQSEQLCFGSEAEVVANSLAKVTATISTDGSNIYSNNSDNANIVEVVPNGTSVTPVSFIANYLVINKADNTKAYVSKSNVTVNYGLSTAVTVQADDARIAAEEAARRAAEEARLAAKRAEEQRLAAEKAKRDKIIAATTNGAAFTYNPTMTVSNEDIWLMACVIDWESGWESYEGKLAVANIILNRVRSPRYAKTISEVVYAKYQFSGVSDNNGGPSAAFQQRLANGPRTQECVQAAMEALSGKNNVKNFTAFIQVGSANVDSYSDFMIIGNHCFY